jgi:hypothetical protein
VFKIISGGQTGVDQSAWDAAMAFGIEIGGCVPNGRSAENGRIPDKYTGLVEVESTDPAVRTVRNVQDSDATLIISHGPLAGGSLLTLRTAENCDKPALHVDLQQMDQDNAVRWIQAWLDEITPAVLNVAGPRASEDPTIAETAGILLRRVFKSFAEH